MVKNLDARFSDDNLGWLTPDAVTSGDHYKGSRGESVFVSTTFEAASGWANTVSGRMSSQVILKIEPPSGTNFQFDTHSLNSGDSYFKGDIPASWITGYSVFKNDSGNIGYTEFSPLGEKPGRIVDRGFPKLLKAAAIHDFFIAVLIEADKSDDVTKAGKHYHRLEPITFPQAKSQHQVALLQGVVAKSLLAVQKKAVPYVRAELEKKLHKADDDDEDAFDWGLAAEISEGLDLTALQIIVDESPDMLTEASADAAKIALARFGVADDSELVDQIDEKAAAYARFRAAELIGRHYDADGNLVPSADAKKRIDESTRNMVQQTIYDGLQDGLRSSEIADLIGAIDSTAFSPERAALIANSEIASAHSQGALAGFKTAKDAGVEVMKGWETSGADPCEDCIENEDASPIDVDDDFPSGDDAPQAHPNCNCSLVPYVGNSMNDEDAGNEDED